MKIINKDPRQNAFETSGRLLSRRPHTVCELRTKLRKRGFAGEIIEETLAKLLSLGFLNDAKFAEAYFEELKAKGFGSMRIRMAMKKRGIADEIILDTMNGKVSPEDEVEAAIAALVKRKLYFSREEDRLKKKQKMFRFLASRGIGEPVNGRAGNSRTAEP
jgi:regulatory protein